MNRYPWWKNVLIASVMLLALLVALPNIFGEEPALQISQENGEKLDDGQVEDLRRTLAGAGVAADTTYTDNGRVMVRFASVEDQIQTSDKVREALGKGYVVALTLAPRTPRWLAALGLKPMSLGLDLRGGVHFLFQVDMETAPPR